MAQFQKMAEMMQLMAKAKDDPKIRMALAKKAAESGISPEDIEAQAQQQGGGDMAVSLAAGLGSSLGAGGAAAAGAGGAGGMSSLLPLITALGNVQQPQQPNLPQAGLPGLKGTGGGGGMDQLLQLLLTQIMSGGQNAQAGLAPGLGSLINGV